MVWTAIAVLLGALVILFYVGDEGRIAGLSSDDFARASELLAVALFLSSGMVVASRFRAARVIGFALAWMAILGALVGIYAYRDELSGVATRIYSELSPSTPVLTQSAGGEPMVAVRRTLRGGFDVTTVVNGHAMPMLVDTGASLVTLTQDDARRAGLDPARLAYVLPVQTANGTIGMAQVRLDEIAVGPIASRRVTAMVAPPGALTRSLLGMSFLGTLSSFEVRGETLYLRGRS